MIDEKERAVRLPMTMIDRADAIIPRLGQTAWGDALRWNTTAVVRLALSRGLAQLEAELAELPAPAEKGKGKGKKART